MFLIKSRYYIVPIPSTALLRGFLDIKLKKTLPATILRLMRWLHKGCLQRKRLSLAKARPHLGRGRNQKGPERKGCAFQTFSTWSRP